MAGSLLKKVVVVIMCLAMATPLFYSMAGGGAQPQQGGIDVVALEKNMRDNIRGLLGPTAEKDLVIRWGKCQADGFMVWLDESGCTALTDAKKRDQCLVKAGMEDAYERVFKTCAKNHVPEDWAALSGAINEESKRYLLSQKTPSIEVAPLAECMTSKVIADLKEKDCPTTAFFQDNGCFWTQERLDLTTKFAADCRGGTP
jgi:hypothetical protein